MDTSISKIDGQMFEIFETQSWQIEWFYRPMLDLDEELVHHLPTTSPMLSLSLFMA